MNEVANEMTNEMTNDKFTFIDRALAERRSTQQWRSLHPVRPQNETQIIRDGRSLVNFSANDYLGLSKHAALISASQEYTRLYGTGATASRLVAGTYEIHQALEENLAQACGREAALLFASGFQANTMILSTLLDQDALVLCDRLVHNSILQGILLSQARFIRYRHNDLNHLQDLLQQSSLRFYSRIAIVTETVFSMDGDRSPGTELVELAQKFNAILYLDDAHALGVLGRDGMGLAADQIGVDLGIGTFGKAFGSFGAFVSCSQKVREYLINCCPGFIYTTALPPSVIGAIQAALHLMPSLEPERRYLEQISQTLRSRLNQLGYDTGPSNSQIIPILIGDSEKAIELSHWLAQKNILATAIRPPTVASGTARIRLALSSQHTQPQLEMLLQALQDFSPS